MTLDRVILLQRRKFFGPSTMELLMEKFRVYHTPARAISKNVTRSSLILSPYQKGYLYRNRHSEAVTFRLSFSGDSPLSNTQPLSATSRAPKSARSSVNFISLYSIMASSAYIGFSVSDAVSTW